MEGGGRREREGWKKWFRPSIGFRKAFELNDVTPCPSHLSNIPQIASRAIQQSAWCRHESMEDDFEDLLGGVGEFHDDDNDMNESELEKNHLTAGTDSTSQLAISKSADPAREENEITMSDDIRGSILHPPSENELRLGEKVFELETVNARLLVCPPALDVMGSAETDGNSHEVRIEEISISLSRVQYNHTHFTTAQSRTNAVVTIKQNQSIRNRRNRHPARTAPSPVSSKVTHLRPDKRESGFTICFHRTFPDHFYTLFWGSDGQINIGSTSHSAEYDRG